LNVNWLSTNHGDCAKAVPGPGDAPALPPAKPESGITWIVVTILGPAGTYTDSLLGLRRPRGRVWGWISFQGKEICSLWLGKTLEPRFGLTPTSVPSLSQDDITSGQKARVRMDRSGGPFRSIGKALFKKRAKDD